MQIQKIISEKKTNYNYGYAANQITMIAGEYLHDLGFCGQGITIAHLMPVSGMWILFPHSTAFGIIIKYWRLRILLTPVVNVFRQHPHGM